MSEFKQGDFGVMMSSYLGYIRPNKSGNMWDIIWNVFDNGVGQYTKSSVDKSLKKIPNSDIIRVGDRFYIKELLRQKPCVPIKLGVMDLDSNYSYNKISISNKDVIDKVSYLIDNNEPFEVYIIHEVKVKKDGLNMKPHKFIVKTNLKSKEKIKISV